MSTGTTQHFSSCSADSPQSFTSQSSIILSQCQDNFTSAVQNTDVDPVKSIPNEVVLPSIDILIQCLPIEKQSVLFPPHPEQVFPTYFQQQPLHQHSINKFTSVTLPNLETLLSFSASKRKLSLQCCQRRVLFVPGSRHSDASLRR